jgi:hypothetical protein
MFLNNKYYIWYYKIISNAISQNRVKNSIDYFEKHHIIPKCLGGNNTKNNLVLLSAKEHFICHILLTKMVEKNTDIWFKLAWAVTAFRRNNKHQSQRVICSRLYETIRKDISTYRKATYDREADIDRRQKISNTMKIVNQNRDKSYFQSDEWKQIAKNNGKSAHTSDRIYKYKNNPNPPIKIKKKRNYKLIRIEKNDIIKEIKQNQFPQYSKYGWKLSIK